MIQSEAPCQPSPSCGMLAPVPVVVIGCLGPVGQSYYRAAEEGLATGVENDYL